MEYAKPLLSSTNTTGRRRTPARFIASCASPRAEPPSPNQPSATRGSLRTRKASAQPTATGSIAGRCETIVSVPRPDVAEVHVAVAAPRRAVAAPEVLGDDAPGRHAAHDVHAEVALGRAADVLRRPSPRPCRRRPPRCRAPCRTTRGSGPAGRASGRAPRWSGSAASRDTSRGAPLRRGRRRRSGRHCASACSRPP